MIKFLENLLYEKTKETQREVLYAQWNYDKKIIPSALQAVSNLFPHYSLHDESHSITIINNIVRVVGKENIEKLSAIDIWLILEASYCHDIGMVVSSNELTRALESNTFIDFYKSIVRNNKDSLYEFANQFELVDEKLSYKSKYLKLEFHDGIKFLLAEYFRRTHADRSKEIINNPLTELGILSPRSVIPPRLFKILGNICAAHTKNFSEVMILPIREVGIDIEDAHPRFISCLLRIGDLLDLDNNRFSEVMLRTLSKIPIDTLNHKAKHLSIESFRVDREIIEITAKCDDYDTAAITQHWFNYLNSEVREQLIHWNTIVPSSSFGYLPTIGSLTVELEGYDYIDGKNKPKFTVDTDKALELLRGAGIYEGDQQCIRELLQNAVDATLIRIWLDHKDSNKDFSCPNSKDFIDLLPQYWISVNIHERQIEGEYKNWLLEIQDNGTGISTEELRYLFKTGSSSNNIAKANIVEEMPIWMRPSGTFGIGFQSVFMITDLVIIETKSYYNEEFQIIELNSPNSYKDGDILLKKEKTSHFTKPGTKVSINYKEKTQSERYSIKYQHRISWRNAYNYDPFSGKSMDIEISRIFDELFDFSKKSPFKINILSNGKMIQGYPKNEKPFEYFDIINSLEFNFYSKLERNPRNIYNENNQGNIYYKNQPTETKYSLMFLEMDVNVHKDKASEVLTLNRNKINSQYFHKLEEQIFDSSIRIVIDNFEFIFISAENKIIGSMFLDYYKKYFTYEKYDIKSFNHWEKSLYFFDNEKIGLKNSLEKFDKIIIDYYNIEKPIPSESHDIDGKCLTIFHHNKGGANTGGVKEAIYFDYLLYKIREFFEVEEVKYLNEKIDYISLSRNEKSYPVSFKDMHHFIPDNRYGSSARMLVPCPEEYATLRLKDDAFKPYLSVFRLPDDFGRRVPVMLSPYVYEEQIYTSHEKRNVVLNDRVYDWVYENRLDQSIMRKNIIAEYKRFVKEYSDEEVN